jgi:hypothetical protein
MAATLLGKEQQKERIINERTEIRCSTGINESRGHYVNSSVE